MDLLIGFGQWFGHWLKSEGFVTGWVNRVDNWLDQQAWLMSRVNGFGCWVGLIALKSHAIMPSEVFFHVGTIVLFTWLMY